MKQYEQVIQVMSDLGGYATLGQLNQRVDVSGWGAKDPYASIRRIVQKNERFFKIKPGLWALKAYKNKLPDHVYSQQVTNKNKKELQEHDHSYYQGLLLEIGNLRNYATYVPNQDKNKKFLDKKLCDVSTTDHVDPFSYDKFVKHVKTIDVSWFNDRRMPECLFEVEHSTTMDRSLIKFSELIDFNVRCYIVADTAREREFKERIGMDTFKHLRNSKYPRVQFYNYERLSRWHQQESIRRDIEPY